MEIVKYIGENEPTKGTEYSAAYDLCAIEEYRMYHGILEIIKTGLRIEIPPQYCGLVLPRSGMAAKHGITVLNSPGLIDSDYRGDINVILIKHTMGFHKIEKGDRVAQLLIMPYSNMNFLRVESLNESVRGEGGFGSTGR